MTEQSTQVRRLGEEFERNWKAGNKPSIEAILQQADPEIRPLLLRNLLSCEIRLSVDTRNLSRLLQRFPDYQAVVNEIFHEPFATAASQIETVTEPVSTTTRYADLKLHRVGGMANLYLAQDRDLGREAVIKQLRDEFRFNTEYSKQLEIEAEITGQLEHPGIVPVFGIGRWGDDPFYVMRVIRGGDLLPAITDFHADGGFNIRTRAKRDQLFHLLEHFCSACNTLTYAHDQGVLHCDVKPMNIMIGNYGETFVVDWGLARTFRKTTQFSNFSESQWRTRVGEAREVSGYTPGYVSPEQRFGTSELRPASDIYSLGATLYHILTNRTQLSGNEPDFEDRLATGRILAPRKINPKIPRPLEAICVKAMSVSLDKRYRTAMELGDDLQSWMRDEEIQAMHDGWGDRVFRWMRRHRAASISIALTSIVVMATAIFIGVTLNYTHGLEKITKRAEELRKDAEEQSAIAEKQSKVAEEQTKVAKEQRQLAEQQSQIANELRKKTEVRFEAALETFENLSIPLLHGEKSNLGIFVPMAHDIRKFADDFLNDKDLIQPQAMHLARVWELRATVNTILESEYDTQLADLKKAENQYRNPATKPSDPAIIKRRLAFNQLFQGRLHVRKLDFSAAREPLGNSLSLFRELQHSSLSSKEIHKLLRYEADAHHELGRAHLGLANSNGSIKFFKDAERQFTSGLELRHRLQNEVVRIDGDEHLYIESDLARSYGFLGDLHLQVGQLDKAIAEYDSSLKFRAELYEINRMEPEIRFQFARGLANFGEVEMVQRRNLMLTIERVERATRVQEDLFKDFPTIPEFRSDLAWTLLQLAELELAAAVNPESGDTLTKEQRFDKARGYAEKAKLKVLSGNGSNAVDPLTIRLRSYANLLLAETLLDVDVGGANSRAEEARLQMKGLGNLPHDEYFKLGVIDAILGQKSDAMFNLKLAVEKGNRQVERFRIHSHLGLKKILELPANLEAFNGLIKEMQGNP